MKTRFAVAVLGALFLALPVCAPAYAQEEIRLLAPGSAKAGIEAVLPAFEAANNVKVNATFVSGAKTKQLAISSDDFDVKVVQPPLADVLAKGNVIAKSQTDLPGAQLGMMVKAGAAKPDIATAAALKKALLAAKSVSYPDPAGDAAAGAAFYAILTKLGIVKEVNAKLKYASGDGAAVKNVQTGAAEIGIAFLGEAAASGVTGVDMVGALPGDVSPPVPLVGFASAHARNVATAAALLQYLSSPATADTYRAHGMKFFR